MLLQTRPKQLCHASIVKLPFALAALFIIWLLSTSIQMRAQNPQKPADANGVTQDKRDARRLERNAPVERELKSGEVHSYEIALTAEQFLKAVVEQKRIDVKVFLFAPDGKRLADFDSTNETHGTEPVLLVAEINGSYKLEVRALEGNARAGRYEIKIAEPRAATEKDANRIKAEQVFLEAELLRRQNTIESLRAALQKYKQALALLREVGERGRVIEALKNTGFAYHSLGERQNALTSYSEALIVSRAVEDRANEALLLNIIGFAHYSNGEAKKALEFYQPALPLLPFVADRNSRAIVLYNVGAAFEEINDKLKGLEFFEQARRIYRELDERHNETYTLGRIGAIYNLLGEKQKALDSYNEALRLYRAAGNRVGEADTLANIGAVYDSTGKNQEATEYFSQAMAVLPSEIAASVGKPGMFQVIDTVVNVTDKITKTFTARRNLNSDEQTTARGLLQMLNETLPLIQMVSRQFNNRSWESKFTYSIGIMHLILGENQKALDLFNQSLKINRANGDRYNESLTLATIARLERDRGNLAQARSEIEAAISLVESLRLSIASQKLRASYFASVQDYYELYTEILMRLHKKSPSENLDALALQVSERAHARSLLELLTESRADIRQGVDLSVLERERTLQRQLNDKAWQQTQQLENKDTAEKAVKIKNEIDALTTELQKVETEIRQKSPRYAALTQPQPLSLKEIQTQVLDSDTLLLEYSLGEAKSYLWAVTPDSITSYELPKRAEIETAALNFYKLLAGRQKQPQDTEDQKRIVEADAQLLEAANKLSRMVLSPAASRLGEKRLLIVADGALQYVPFAALPSPKSKARSLKSGQVEAPQPLIVDNEIVNLPSASTLAVLRREIQGRAPAPGTVAVLADPVFKKDDLRFDEAAARRQTKSAAQSGKNVPPVRSSTSGSVTRASEQDGITRKGLNIFRIDATRREAQSILDLVPAGAGGGVKFLDFKASRATVESGELARYRIVHFATHGFLDSEYPELSNIVLSLVDERGEPQDGFLRLHEIYNLKLPVELVVLSACQTALGKEIKGEGLVGVTRGFMYAGAPRVVASLWDVDDGATRELMERFYGAMLKDKLRPAAALRRAQTEMAKQRLYGKPYYWAAFVLQGEWK